MSDFLANLMDRSLERLPVLRRRRPSLFEPVSDRLPLLRSGPWSGTDDGEQEVVRDPESIRETSPGTVARGAEMRESIPRRVKGTPPDSETSANRSIERTAPRPEAIETIIASQLRKALPVMQRDDQDHRRGGGEDGAKPGSPHEDREVRPSVPPIDERLAGLEQKAPKSPRHSPPTDIGRPERRIETLKVEPVARPLPGSTSPDRRSPEKSASKLAREARARETEEPAAVKRARATPPPVRRAAPASLPPFPRNGPLATSAPAAGPAPIQVTIGRVEVRASEPKSPPPRRSMRAKPKLSLEDYLRSRGGGTQ